MDPISFFNPAADLPPFEQHPDPAYSTFEPDAGEAAALMSYSPATQAVEIVPSSENPNLEPEAGMETHWDPFAPGHYQQYLPPEAPHPPLFVDPGVDPGLCDAPNDDEEMKDGLGRIHDPAMETGAPPTRRTSSTNSESFSSRYSDLTDITAALTPPDQDQSRKPKPKKTKKGANDLQEQKRDKFLERNRIAASKCREKKKAFVVELEEQKVSLEATNGDLVQELKRLASEISDLKHRLMAHAKCNDANIDKWLNNEASRYVQTSQAPQAASDLLAHAFGYPPAPISLPADEPQVRDTDTPYPFDAVGSGERHNSIAYSHASSSLYAEPSPADGLFPMLNSPHPKREPEMNYNHMPDAMFEPDQPSFSSTAIA